MMTRKEAEIRVRAVPGDGPFRIAFDIEQMKPGCVLLQAVLASSCMAHCFESRLWLTTPTPNMRVYSITREELVLLVQKVHTVHADHNSRRLTEKPPNEG